LRGTRSYLLVSQAKLPPPRRSASLSLAAPRYSITNSTVPVLARYSGPPDRLLSVADHRWHIGNAKIAIHATILRLRARKIGDLNARVIFFPLFSRENECTGRSFDFRVSFILPLFPTPSFWKDSRVMSSIEACVKTRVLIDRDREDRGNFKISFFLFLFLLTI